MINDVDFKVLADPAFQTVSVEVKTELDNGAWCVTTDLSEEPARKLIRDLESALRVLKASRGEANNETPECSGSGADVFAKDWCAGDRYMSDAKYEVLVFNESTDKLCISHAVWSIASYDRGEGGWIGLDPDLLVLAWRWEGEAE